MSRKTAFASFMTLAIVASSLLGPPVASAAGGYGHVDFANSGAPAAQADFEQGMALLHDFEYDAAAAAFQRAEATDPGFAMAYWGEAMTHNHPIWMQQDRDAAMAALKKLGPTPAARRAKAKTDREKGYLDAVEILYGPGEKQARDFQYEQAMRKLHERYPDDVDAAAFYGLSILGTAHAGRDEATYMRAAGVLEEAWVNHREHPGLVHYLIHSYDDPVHAPLGLRAARIYARIAPDAGHAQHMTSHIFLALGMWKETVDANIAAIADVDRMRKAAGKPALGCGHYPSWLAYAYLQLGNLDEARHGLERCDGSVKAQAGKDHATMAMDPDESLSGSLANMRLRYLIDTGDVAGSGVLEKAPASTGPGGRLDLAFGRVLAAVAQARASDAKVALDSLEAIGNVVT
ncbi:MAG: hypothetical protein ACM3JJ_04050, partial [Hyphomicrobiales bacterium]